MKITKDMVLKSLATFHKTCGKHECRHSEAFTEAGREMANLTMDTLAKATEDILGRNENTMDLSPMEVISSYLMSTGIHIGYRLKEVELQAEKEINDLNKSL
jgi:hypothetical protein